MSTADPRIALQRLLELPRRRDLLLRWQAIFPDAEDPSARVYAAILACSRVDPALALRATEHLRSAMGRSLPRIERARLLRLHAHVLRSCGDAHRAIPLYVNAWQGFLACHDRAEQVRTAIGWTDALALAGSPAQAQRVANSARRLLSRADTVQRARLEANLGNAWLLGGRLERAQASYERALRLLQRGGREWDVAGCVYNLGLLQFKRGRIAAARELFERARGAFDQAGMTVPALYAHAGLARAELVLGRWDAGLTEIDQLCARFEGVGDRRALARMHRELGALFGSLGATASAREHTARALQAYRELGLSADAASTAYLHGRLLAVDGEVQDSAACLHEAQREYQRAGNRWGVHRAGAELGRLHLEAGDLRRAVQWIAPASAYLSRRDPHGDGAVARALLARTRLQAGRLPSALRLAQQARTRAAAYPARLERPGMTLLVAHVHAARGDDRNAVRWAQRAVAELEALLSRFGTRSTRTLAAGARDRVYREAIEIVLEHGGAGANRLAVDLLSRARSSALVEDLLQGHSGSAPPDLRAALSRLRDELLLAEDPTGDSGTRARGLQTQLKHLQSRLRGDPRRLPSLVRRALRRRSLRHWLPALGGRELVFYQRSERGWRAFVVRPDGGIERVELGDAAGVLRTDWPALRMTFEIAAHLPQERRAEFLRRTLDDSLSGLQRLRAALWEPLPLQGESVVVVPDGPLHAVPLEALAIGGTDAPSRQPAMTRLPHPALLRRTPARRSTRALVLHGPQVGSGGEVGAIQRALGGAGLSVAVDDRRAALEEVDEPLAVLHIAAHGTFHREGWLLSGIQLAEGWMGFEQLRRRSVAGALVYFASCESGLTQEAPGAELEGWLTAGLSAGARALVLSLWKLDDVAAVAFAREFYPAWAQGMSASAAVTWARRQVRREHPHPYLWAPIVAVG